MHLAAIDLAVFDLVVFGLAAFGLAAFDSVVFDSAMHIASDTNSLPSPYLVVSMPGKQLWNPRP